MQEKLASQPAQPVKECRTTEKVTHESNEWGKILIHGNTGLSTHNSPTGISLVDESVDNDDKGDGMVGEGLRYQYSPPTPSKLVATDTKPVR